MSKSLERIIADAILSVVQGGVDIGVMNTTEYDFPKVAMYPVENNDIDGINYVEGSQGEPMLYVILDASDNIIESMRLYYQYADAPYFSNGYKKVSNALAQTIIDNSSLGGLGAIGG